MATIALYANKINSMPGLVKDIRNSVNDLKSEFMTLKSKSQSINRNICNLDDVISSISTSTQTQEDKMDTLNNLAENVKEFASDVERIDNNVATMINKSKNDFYDKYDYLKPFWEKNLFEQMWDVHNFLLKSAAEWCKEHWKEITTVLVVLGAIVAIAAVVLTGGMALAPMLAALLTSLGMASGTALTVATITSLVVGGIAIASTAASATLELVDIWCDMGGNSTFQFWKNVMNWTSTISNLFYSFGGIYNAFHGIGDNALKEYGKNYLKSSDFRNNILKSNNYNFNLKQNTSVFWTGMSENGGEHVAKNYIKRFGGESLETMLAKNGVVRIPPASVSWGQASSSMAINSSGEVKVLIGSTPWAGSVWNTTERILLNINPNVKGIKEISGVTIKYIPRIISNKEIGKSIKDFIDIIREDVFDISLKNLVYKLGDDDKK